MIKATVKSNGKTTTYVSETDIVTIKVTPNIRHSITCNQDNQYFFFDLTIQPTRANILKVEIEVPNNTVAVYKSEQDPITFPGRTVYEINGIITFEIEKNLRYYITLINPNYIPITFHIKIQ